MKKVLVIGGGLAGLSAASFLSANNYKVELIEAALKLGGRAYSFLESKTQTEIDNGQHLLMGCYDYTLKFLNLIDAKKNFEIQQNLDLVFLSPGFKIHRLSASGFFYPLNLLVAFLKYDALTFPERLSVIKFLFKILSASDSELHNANTSELLLREKQSANCRKAFWDILIISAFNCSAENISAKLFKNVIKQIFLSGKSGMSFIIPKLNLNKAFNLAAANYIQENGGKIFLSERVTELASSENEIKKIITNKRTITDFDFIISAVPPYSLHKIKTNNYLFEADCFEYSTILNIHLWMGKNHLDKNFYALIDSPVHWVFNKGSYLNLVISNANEFNEMDNEQILNIALTELEKYLLISPEHIIHSKIVKEKRATFLPSIKSQEHRCAAKTDFKNFFLAGDWTNTGLPSTIESAVKSGWVAFTEMEHQAVGK